MTAAARLSEWQLRQPDRTTCGSASLVVAGWLISGARPIDTELDPATFAADCVAIHRRTSAWWRKTPAGRRLQLPWPRALGTWPWTVAGLLSDWTATRYRVRFAHPDRPAELFDRIVAAVRADRPVPVFVGDRLCPRHVVLALPAETATDRLSIYEPSAGTVVELTRNDVTDGFQLAGWDQLWLAVVPAPPSDD